MKQIEKSLIILLTGAGAPGVMGTIYALRNNYENRKVFVIGTDIKENVVGKYLCDKFYVIPSAKEADEYLSALKKICIEDKVDIIIPQNTAELSMLADKKNIFKTIGVGILVSDRGPIEIANNKYTLFQAAEKERIPVACYSLVSDFESLQKSARDLGWPDKKVVVKPPVSNGSRGVRVIAENIDRKKAFYEEKPSSLFVTLDELYGVLGDYFPELIVMEYLPGDEYTVDIFRSELKTLVIPRRRLMIRSGITFAACLEKNESLINDSKKLADALGLTFCFGFQFKQHEDGRPLLLESNPRVQGSMVMSAFANANVIYNSVKLLLEEPIEDQEIDWDAQLLRYWGAIGIKEDGIIRI